MVKNINEAASDDLPTVKALCGATGNKIRLSIPADGVALLTLAHPPVNAIDDEMLPTLMRVFGTIDGDVSIRAMIISGEGKHFCAGADLKEKAESEEPDGAQFWQMIRRLETLRVPVIAAVHGACAGGGLELALSCDIRIAADSARFICAGVNVGLTASATKLPRLIGLSNAKTMLLTGLPFGADAGLSMGLTVKTVASEALQQEALQLAERISSRAPLAVEATKRIANRALDLNCEDAAKMQKAESDALRASEDHQIGLRAVLDKKRPEFKRR